MVSAVVIGMDPHKRSATIEVMAGDETVLDGGRFATDIDGYRGVSGAHADVAEQGAPASGRP